MKKTALKLIPAAAMLLVSAIMVSTATFAWFSMNTTVQVTGMSLTAVTPANLVVSKDGSDWSNTISISDQNSSGKLFPASTYDAVSFNAVTDGNYIGSGAGGVAENSTAFQPTASVAQLSSSAQATETGYWYEYSFKLKLSEEEAPDVNVYLSKLVIKDTSNNAATSNGTITDIDGAVRVALFVDGTLKKIYANNKAADSYDAIGENISVVTEFSDLHPTTWDAGTNYIKADANGDIAETVDELFVVDGENVKNIKIVVWIEGQDPACKNSATGRSFSVDLDFSVSDTPVNP